MRRRVATLTAAACMLALLVPVASVSATSTTYVRPGQSIQAAIDGAAPGAVIRIAHGTYREDLEIVRPVRLVGDGAVIVPPAVQTENLCTTPGFFDGLVGICIHGAIDFSTGDITPVAGVAIAGLTVRGFGGPGIVFVGVSGFRGTALVTADSGEMGMFINHVSDFSLTDSRSYGNQGDGLFVELGTDLELARNALYDNLGSGVLFLGSLGGSISGNDLHGNCAGIIVASATVWPVGFPEQVPAGDIAVEHNQVTANNGWCPVDNEGTPAYGGIGIALVGARNTIVDHNQVRLNQEQAGSTVHGGGISVIDGAIFYGFAPSGNSIRLNQLSGNTPFDIYGDGSGSSNTFGGNSCQTTNLAGACW